MSMASQHSARNSLIERQKEQIRKVERQRKENQEVGARYVIVLRWNVKYGRLIGHKVSSNFLSIQHWSTILFQYSTA